MKKTKCVLDVFGAFLLGNDLDVAELRKVGLKWIHGEFALPANGQIDYVLMLESN